MAGRKNVRALYVRCFEHDGYWTTKIAFDEYDSEGTPDEALTLRQVAKHLEMDTPMDQAYVLLVDALKYLEAQGATGRVSGVDWQLPL